MPKIMSEIKELRVRAGVTQTEAAAYMLVSRRTIYNWEIGNTRISQAEENALKVHYRNVIRRNRNVRH